MAPKRAKYKTADTVQAAPKPYYGVFLFQDGAWHYHFGDYDRAVAVQEGQDERESKGLRAKDVKVECFQGHNLDGLVRDRLAELNAPPPVQQGQIVYVSVIRKFGIAGDGFDASPSLFATREAAQADCDNLNKTRMSKDFVVREMTIG